MDPTVRQGRGQLRFGSLFSGIGGIDLGLERAGMTCAWQSEVDPFSCEVLAKQWPDVPQLGGVEMITKPPAVDLIAGGFPCVTTSQAGLRTGAEDERWLWPEMRRIIRDVGPRYVLVENPPGVLVRGGHELLGDLAALGYDAEWEVISAAAVGADHVRDRVWFVAYPRGGRRQVFGLSELGRVLGEPRRFTHRRRDRWQLKDAPSRGSHWETEPAVGRVADGVPGRVARLSALGRAAVPQVAEWIGRKIMEYDNENTK